MKRALCLGISEIHILLLFISLIGMSACGHFVEGVRVDDDGIGGAVVSENGPEAGVWVIAETIDLPTKFVKIVVTNERGRYMLPDLPKAKYSVWVRGYGLVDSPKVQASPGTIVNLTAVLAPDPHVAAQYYPADYWYSLLQLPPETDFPGRGANGKGISENVKSRGQWIDLVKTNNCVECHQMGDKATREVPTVLGNLNSSSDAWLRRVASGQVGPTMIRRLQRFGVAPAVAMFADWTDRIVAGELPPIPPRPQGLERNVVITEWDWGGPKEYFHDEIATDRRNPTLNAHGPVYGVEETSSDYMSVVNPTLNTAGHIQIPVRDADTPYAAPQTMMWPSLYWGEESVRKSRVNAHSLMMDAKGRIWSTSVIRPPGKNPAFCRQGSSNPSAVSHPLQASGRQVSVYDPITKKFTLIDMCFDTFHLMFAEDTDNTLWFSNGGNIGENVRDDNVVGWLNTKIFDETHDEAKSEGWTPLVLDTNGNGKRDAYIEPNQPADPTKDKRIPGGFYGINPSPVDGSVWGSVLGFPGAIVRLSPGQNPPTTALAEIYEPPWENPKVPVHGYGPRGLDIDRNGVVWTPLSSGDFASFDRRKCRGPLNGPTATGQQCPEGWTLYPIPGPPFKGTESGSADSNYYAWVDQFDTFGLGKNVPIATGNDSDSLLVLLPDKRKFVVLRVPYPMGFYAKGLDGRIDDPNAGWKGRGLWSTYATQAPWHIEGGKRTTSKLVHFQIRPDPLAK